MGLSVVMTDVDSQRALREAFQIRADLLVVRAHHEMVFSEQHGEEGPHDRLGSHSARLQGGGGDRAESLDGLLGLLLEVF